jgi:hypothetical protein
LCAFGHPNGAITILEFDFAKIPWLGESLTIAILSVFDVIADEIVPEYKPIVLWRDDEEGDEDDEWEYYESSDGSSEEDESHSLIGPK